MTVDNLIRGYTVGLFTQEPELDENKTVREIVEEGAQEVVNALNDYNRINEKFAEPMSDDEMRKLAGRKDQRVVIGIRSGHG